MALEKPGYKVIEKEEKFEIREYKPYIVAETHVQGDFRHAGNMGFRRLAGYIFGNNKKKNRISMTAPVMMKGGSEKIAMTAPVQQEFTGSEWRITFMMPSKYTLDTLPEPLDPLVKLMPEPGETAAAIRYSGTWSEQKHERMKLKLIEWIRTKGYEIIGEPVIARYDPPWRPAFMRRNEVLIPVKKAE